MQTFRVGLVRTFLVDIKANNESDALHFAELFTSNIQDESTEKDRDKLGFQIGHIELMENEAFEVEEIGAVFHIME